MVCTGNICRSPMAEGLLRERLARAGVPARVHSAGLLTEDRPPSGHGVTAMSRRGIDIAQHRSRRLAAELIASADLVVGMERQHVREVVVLDRDAFGRAFTLPELARIAETIGPRRPGEAIQDWVERAGAGRRPSDMVGSRPADEVADPIGRSAREYEATAAQLDELVATVVDHLFPGHGERTCA